MKFRSWQSELAPARQAGQVPHQASGITVTGSPADQPLTPLPIARTVPDISCPSTAGRVTRPSIAPCRMCRSEPQMPVNATSICTEPDPGSTTSAGANASRPSPTYHAARTDSS